MKTKIQTLSILLALTATVIILAGACANPTSISINTSLPDGESGVLRINAETLWEPEAPASPESTVRTILPTDLDLEILGYGFSATSPSGAILSSPDSPDGAFFLNRVQPGFWTVTLTGKNLSGMTVAGGTARVQVEAGKVKDVSVFLAPTGSVTGTLQLSLSWEVSVELDSVRLTLDPPLATGPITQSCTGTTSLELILPLSPGSYRATLEYFEGASRIKTQIRSAQIYSGIVTQAAFDLAFQDFNGSMSLGPWRNLVPSWSPWLSGNATSTLVHDGYIFFAGGGSSPAFSSSFKYASLSTTGAAGPLLNGPDFPFSIAHATLVAWKDRLYLVGGERNLTSTTKGFNGQIFSIGIGETGVSGTWRNEGVAFYPQGHGHALIWAYDNPLFPPAKPFLVFVNPVETRIWPINADGSLDLVSFANSAFAPSNLYTGGYTTYPGWVKAMVHRKSVNENYLYAIGLYPGTYGKLVVKYIKLESTGALNTSVGWQTLDPVTGTAPPGGAWEIGAMNTLQGGSHSFLSTVTTNVGALYRLDVGFNGLPTFTSIDDQRALSVPGYEFGGAPPGLMFQDSGYLYTLMGTSPTKSGATVTSIDQATGTTKLSQKAFELPYGDSAIVAQYGGFIYSAAPVGSALVVLHAPLGHDGEPGAWVRTEDLALPKDPYASTLLPPAVLTATKGSLYLLSGTSIHRSIINADGSPGSWGLCDNGLDPLIAGYPSYTSILGYEKVIALGDSIYVFAPRLVFWSKLDAEGNPQAWSSKDFKDVDIRYYGTSLPFEHDGRLMVLYNSVYNQTYLPALIMRVDLDENEALTGWTEMGRGIELIPEITGDTTTHLQFIGATGGPKGAYLLTNHYPNNNTGKNYVMGLRFDEEGKVRDSRIVGKAAFYRESVLATFTFGGYYYLLGGKFRVDTSTSTYYIRKDIQYTGLEP